MSLERMFTSREGRERRLSRDEIVRDLKILLEVDQGFNLTGQAAEVFKHPTIDTDVIVQLKNTDSQLEESTSAYEALISRIELGDGTFPVERMELSEWEGVPCLLIKLPS